MKNEEEKIPNSDMDGGWKDIIEDFTEEFFSFYLPEMHGEIDFLQEIRFLDRELNEIVSDSENIKREADRLLEVYLKNGRAEWILIHIEVQSYRNRTFAERMYIYNYRIFDKYQRYPVSIAVLTDGERSFRPDNFRLEHFEEGRKMPYMTSTERIAREEGIMQGMQRGITQGIAQGIPQGISRGQLENAREALLDILEVRFGQLAAVIQEKVNSCNDLRKLKKVLRQAVLIGSPDELDL